MRARAGPSRIGSDGTVWLLRRPDRQHVPGSIVEVKSLASGEFEGGHRNSAASSNNGGFSRLQVGRIEHDQRRGVSVCRAGLALTETAVDAGPGGAEADVFRTPIFKGPSEDRGLKLLRACDIGHGEFDVIDGVVFCCLTHIGSAPWLRIGLGRGEGMGELKRRHTVPSVLLNASIHKPSRARRMQVESALKRFHGCHILKRPL
jgi:hypothetical protein